MWRGQPGLLWLQHAMEQVTAASGPGQQDGDRCGSCDNISGGEWFQREGAESNSACSTGGV